ncbi:MAG TPA: aldo/keto reductase [Candidatus Acidoferrales bacterium]|nr:aldo/keto reductase [Candidatus Acidoferrales bacterium]
MENMPSRRTFLLSGAAVTAVAQTKPEEPGSPAVRYRVLGRTGLKVTELGFGSEAVSDLSVFERALDAGINFFDSARNYQNGNAERALGAALRGKRNQVILCTRSYADNARQAALDLDDSLKALGTDHVDIWYLGQKDSPGEIKDDMLDAQHAAQKAGKIRFRGVSSHRPAAIADFAIRQKFDAIQIPYNFAIGTRRDPFNLDASNLDPTLDRFKEAGIGVVAMKVMAGGYRGIKIEEKNLDIHARSGSRIAAIRWALRNDRVQTTSVRMMDRDQLEENLRAMSGTFSERDARLLAAYTDAVRPVLCRMCGGCDGQCPYGTPVGDVVRALMYAEGYGSYEKGLETFRSAGAVRCSECRTCTVSCPNGVRVAERMRRAQQLFG